MSEVHCSEFPNKKRWGRHNRDGARTHVQELQRRLRRNFRIYKCDTCKGYHITSLDINEYNLLKEQMQKETEDGHSSITETIR